MNDIISNVISVIIGATASSTIWPNTVASPNLQRLISSSVISGVVLHPRRTAGSLRDGVVGMTNLITGRVPELVSHPILRTTESLVETEMQNAAIAQQVSPEALVEAINTGSNHVTGYLSNFVSESIRNQQKINFLCAVIPITVFTVIYLKNNSSFQQKSVDFFATTIDKIPSTDKIGEMVKLEVSKQIPTAAPAVVGISVQQICIVSGVSMLFGVFFAVLVIKIVNQNSSCLRT